MLPAIRPRRSVLFMPGSNARALEKAASVPADGLIFDLEDAVAPGAKEAARAAVIEALRSRDYGPRERVVRVNALSSPWGHADLVAAATCGADAVLLPKVEGPDTVRQAVAVLADAGAPDSLELWCMMETALGVLRAEAVASSSPRLAVLVMGTSDLAKELGAAHTRDRLPLVTGLGLCLLAARALGLGILDGVHLDLADDEGFEHACRQGRELGFDGKTLIHPKTIEVANRVFAPSAGEVEAARRVIEAHERARAEGRGVAVVDGKLVENLHVVCAKRTLQLAQAISARESA
jgi:citrate lyase subunit beta/citryl-CoA lyase